MAIDTYRDLCRACGKSSINPLRDGRCIVCELLQQVDQEHEPGCDGSGLYHGRHDCSLSGDSSAGCFATCEACS